MSMSPDRRPGEVVRPRQVTLAGWLVIAASLMLVVSVFEQMADLRSLETRTSIEQFLSEPPGSQLGVGRESLLRIIRIVSMVAAGLATAAGILGWHVLKRNRSARVALTVLALPLFFCGLVTGGFLASVVLASVAMLWLAPSRHWFAGTAPSVSLDGRRDRLGRTDPPTPGGPPAASGPSSSWPPPLPLPPAGPPASAAGQPPPWTPHAGPAPWGAPAGPSAEALPAPSSRRPTPATVACAITWTCCALTALLSLTLLVALATDAAGLFEQMQRRNPELAEQGVSDSTLESISWVIGVGCLAWAVASGVLAVLAFNRSRWATTALVVSSAVVALFCLAGSLVSPPLVVPGVLAAAVAVLLLQPSVQRWLGRRDARQSASGPGGMM